MIEEKIEQDLKKALLAGDANQVSTLRFLKSSILNVKVASGKRGSMLDDQTLINVLSKESKKRQESANMYLQGGNQLRAEAELAEKVIIDSYLPVQLSEAEISNIIDSVINKNHNSDMSSMGQVIGQVKEITNGAADGSIIARLTKEKLSK